MIASKREGDRERGREREGKREGEKEGETYVKEGQKVRIKTQSTSGNVGTHVDFMRECTAEAVRAIRYSSRMRAAVGRPAGRPVDARV